MYLSTQVAGEDMAFLIRLGGGTRLGCPTLNLFFGTQYRGTNLGQVLSPSEPQFLHM